MLLVRSSLALSWPRLAVLAVLAVSVILVVLVLAGLADALPVASAPAGDGPLLAPFRWWTVPPNVG